MQVEYEERLRAKDAEAEEAQAAFEKQLAKRARRFEAQQGVEAKLHAEIEKHKVWRGTSVAAGPACCVTPAVRVLLCRTPYPNAMPRLKR